MDNGKPTGPRGQQTREVLNASFKIRHPSSAPIRTCDLERNKVIAEYTHKEMELYLSGSNSVSDFAKASQFWKKIANPDGTINSAYGYLIWHEKSCGDPTMEVPHFEPGRMNGSLAMRTPWEWARNSMLQDKDTRQAFLRFSLPRHQWVGNRDQVCTMHGHFVIRDDKLNFSIVMRSNDCFKGLVYDLPFFIKLMELMADELKPTYPNLQVGEYFHLAHSLHIYESDIPKILKMLGSSA